MIHLVISSGFGPAPFDSVMPGLYARAVNCSLFEGARTIAGHVAAVDG